MNVPELLAACSKNPDLPFLVIGGHAVIAHGYPRTTFDVDLLIRRAQSGSWTKQLIDFGYRLEGQELTFARFSPPPGGLDLDLMLVDDATFTGMWQTAQTTNLLGIKVKIPGLDHLLALKLHVLKQNQRHRIVKDLDDIIRLVLANGLNVETEHYQKLFAKYGNLELLEKVRAAVCP